MSETRTHDLTPTEAAREIRSEAISVLHTWLQGPTDEFPDGEQYRLSTVAADVDESGLVMALTNAHVPIGMGKYRVQVIVRKIEED